jgi:hypothetical protein
MYLHPTYAVSTERDRWAYWMRGCGRANHGMPMASAVASAKARAGSKAAGG